MSRAAEAGDPAAVATYDLFAELVGLLCRELSLRFMPLEGLFLAGSVGRALPGVGVRVVDDHGQASPQGDAGHVEPVVARPPQQGDREVRQERREEHRADGDEPELGGRRLGDLGVDGLGERRLQREGARRAHSTPISITLAVCPPT